MSYTAAPQTVPLTPQAMALQVMLLAVAAYAVLRKRGAHLLAWLTVVALEAGGGTLVTAGTPEDVAACEASFTGRYLKRYL